MNRLASFRFAVHALVMVPLVAGVLLSPGCSKPQPTAPSRTDQKSEARGDPWEAISRRLRSETDPAACKGALAQLNSELANRPDLASSESLTPEKEKAIAALIQLTPSDVAEIRPSGFSSLDSAYLADCFYLRDVARSLDLPGPPPAAIAELGFAWVCRQIYIQPWRLPYSPGLDLQPVVPPTYALRRGSGSGLDRAYAFLALLQQMGLDGCLVGAPDAGDKTAVPRFPADTKSPPRGPFWGVGVRIGADIHVFDPWRGSKLPGTLAQIQAKPELMKPWFEDATNPWGVTADDVKKAKVYLAVPISSLSPRIAQLDSKMKAESGVRLSVELKKLQDRFLAPTPNGPGLKASDVAFWNPPGDRFAYGRVLATFLPVSEGGTDAEAEGSRLFDRYVTEQIPRTVFGLPRDLVERDAQERLRVAAYLVYKRAFLDPPTPRERLQRGQFQDASRFLTERADGFKLGQERLAAAGPADIAAWCELANMVYADLGRARLDNDPIVVANAQAAVERFWAVQGGTAQIIIDRASAQVGFAEATYLLALAKHEEAERAQARADWGSGSDVERARQEAIEAWTQSAGVWAAYDRVKEAQSGFPGRAAHVKELSARATKLASRK